MNTDQKQEAGRPETEEIRMSHCFSLRWGLRRQRTSDISHRFALILTDRSRKEGGEGALGEKVEQVSRGTVEQRNKRAGGGRGRRNCDLGG